MKQRILLLFVLVTALGSCTTMYKSGQTPDDVYFSPAKEVPAYVETDDRREDRYVGEDEYLDERYLRMKSMNRNRWSAFDNDFMYWNDYRWNNQVYFNSFRPYSYNSFGLGYHPAMGYGSGFNTGFYNGFYSPFLPGYYGAPVVVVAKPVNPRAYVPRNGNLGTYTTGTSTYSTDPKTGNRTYNLSGSRTISNNSGGGSGGGYYNPSNKSSRTYSNGNESRTYSAPSRSFDNSNSSSGSSRSNSGSSSSGNSGSSSSGSAPVRSFPRGGN